MNKKCLRCDKELSDYRIRKGSQHCSGDCHKKWVREKYVKEYPGKRRKERSTSSVGAIHELMVCVDLMQKGYHVFRSQSPSCPCDLIAMTDDKTYLVEVTTGQKRKNGYSFPKKGSTYHFDWLAVVFHDGDIFYYKNNYEVLSAEAMVL